MSHSPEQVIDGLVARDAFSQWLGIDVLDARVGYSRIRMTVRADMANGFGTSHGGIVFSFADSAFAFATNAAGTLAVAIDASISFPVAVQVGDVLTAIAEQESVTNKLGFCTVTVRNQHDVTVGHFRGTVYRTNRAHSPSDASP